MGGRIEFSSAGAVGGARAEGPPRRVPADAADGARPHRGARELQEEVRHAAGALQAAHRRDEQATGQGVAIDREERNISILILRDVNHQLGSITTRKSSLPPPYPLLTPSLPPPYPLLTSLAGAIGVAGCGEAVHGGHEGAAGEGANAHQRAERRQHQVHSRADHAQGSGGRAQDHHQGLQNLEEPGALFDL
eukprot:1183596-Prorocentrum_minimum.AAC.2